MAHKKNSELFSAAQRLLPRMVAWRRAIHQHPELGFQEKKTSALVARELAAGGWQVRPGVAKTGVIGLLSGPKPGPCFAIRADMDALPLQEQNQHAYASRVQGRMHACGHDGNTAMALAAARLLAQQREKFCGSIKLIFQPCEETPPGGAQAMIAAKALASPRVAAVIAGHMDTSLATGSIGIRSGAMMAAADAFTLTIQGQGGHGAMPHKSVDAIAIAGQVISALQQVVSRELDPLEPGVLTLGTIAGGEAYNIIAEKVQLRGTLRTLSDFERREMPRRVKRVAENLARALRGKAQFLFEPGHPALYNDPGITQLVQAVACQVLGGRGVKVLERPVMSGEDFTYFARAVPACFFRVGGRSREKKHQYPWHHPRFDFDEQGMVAGAAVLAGTALEFLKGSL